MAEFETLLLILHLGFTVSMLTSLVSNVLFGIKL